LNPLQGFLNALHLKPCVSHRVIHVEPLHGSLYDDDVLYKKIHLVDQNPEEVSCE